MEESNLYKKLIDFNKPSSLISGFIKMKLDKKLPNFYALDLGAGVRK